MNHLRFYCIAYVFLVLVLGCKGRNSLVIPEGEIVGIAIEEVARTSGNGMIHQVAEDSREKTLFGKGDIVHVVASRLNRNEQEPVKFFPKYRIVITYSNQEQFGVMVSGNGEYLKRDGLTYRLEESIEQYLPVR